MPARLCQLCHTSRAILKRPKTSQRVCKPCFFYVFEEEIHRTIVDAELFQPGDKVAIGASGGKGESCSRFARVAFSCQVADRLRLAFLLADSTVLAHIMKILNDRYAYGLDLFLLSIDEGITGYRDDSLEVRCAPPLLNLLTLT